MESPYLLGLSRSLPLGSALIGRKRGEGGRAGSTKKRGAHSPNLKISSKTFRFNKPIPKFFSKTSLTQVALNLVTVYWPRVQVIQRDIELTC